MYFIVVDNWVTKLSAAPCIMRHSLTGMEVIIIMCIIIIVFISLLILLLSIVSS